MRRDELVTKLARELPQWPAGLNKEQLARLIAPVFMPPYSGLYYGCVDNFGETEAYLHIWDITRADYLAECDRLGVTAPEPMPGPVKSAWNGEGLPPVGVVCEYYWQAGDEYREGVVLAHHGGAAVIRDAEEWVFEGCFPHQVRPLRNEEDRAVDEMWAIARQIDDADDDIEMCRALYRAGYRKAEGGDV